MKDLSPIEALMYIVVIGILAAIFAPLIANAEDRGIAALRNYLEKSNQGIVNNQNAFGVPSSGIPNLFAPKLPANTQQVIISSPPLLLREQIISQRVGAPTGNAFADMVGRAAQGAFVDAEMGRGRH